MHQHVDGEIVLLHFATERYYGLDDVGTRVWELLKEHAAIDPIVAALLSDYDVDEATLRRDIDRLLGELADAGLIHVEGVSDP